ncbi:hypothetical protein [Raoultibacter timonensis]|uniref:HTH cro/C1-type domain-containing protein n=1 Tax=Raoultibacter timonensis TaxID=1907662 RepID=A0ABM7WF25_9ACTN|nr:hypothetical protein [Raoultibacter timonensis]BDE94835.1 hypothetical protein CE91St30_01680 [Raoultibacter timonensis]BDF49438.1 hypothetical protein CE91St31_01680 [Raoultibacter timonensis]
MPCLATPKIDYGPLYTALSELSRIQRIDYRSIATATGVPFKKIVCLMNLRHAPNLNSVELVNLARFAEVPLSEVSGSARREGDRHD